MSKREERLLSESGRQLSTPADEQQPTRKSSGDWAWDAAHLDVGDGLSEQQGSEAGQRSWACKPQHGSEAARDVEEDAAPKCAAYQDEVHPPAPPSAGNGAASLPGGPQCQTSMDEKAANRNGRGGNGSAQRQLAQPSGSVAVALIDRSEGLDPKIRPCSVRTVHRESEMRQAAMSRSRSGVHAELQQLQEMFSSGAPSSYVGPGGGMPLTQEQADLALAAKMQDEEVRLHRKRVSATSRGAPFKTKTAKVNTLDAFVKRTA